MRLYSPEGDALGAAEIVSMTDIEGYTPKTNLRAEFDANTFDPKVYARVKLNAPVKNMTPGGWITNASRNCSGFEIKNTYYANIRSRGILVKGSDGLIENCTIYNTGSAGILLAPEFNWMEAAFVHNVTLRNNTLIKNGYGNAGQGAIYVYSMYGRDNRNIVIEGNTIRDCAYWAMDLSCIDGLKVFNNKVESRDPDYTTPVSVIRIDKVKNAEIYGNTFPDGWTEIEVTSDTENINVK